ncbi:MAG: polysaccharide biosynthesis/export family protein [Syntrophaceae bacterium]|nr:polysaccharide biosynthesis/export family protein [Syntrophaceae bacterium]
MEIMRHRGTTRGYRSIALLGVLVVLLIFPSPTVGQGKANLIGPQDVLTLSIYAGGEEQRKVDLTVSNDDMINAPFIGPIKARGLTISELETLIAELLKKDYFVDPQVHIQIKEGGYKSLQYSVSVEGKVTKPGVYEYQRGITALNACLMAGGFDKFAAPNRARIIREEDGKQTVIRINLEDVKEGKIPDIELKPGDIVVIPESWL